MTIPILARHGAAILGLIFACVAIAPLGECRAQVDDGIAVDAGDWPWWRGPDRNGVAHPEQSPPTEWSETTNIAWRCPIPGRGDSSPTVVGPRIFLATADEQQNTQSVLCIDRATGQQLWQTVVHRGGIMRKNEKSTGASSTVACDGERVYINFASSDAVYVTALTVEGELVWQTRLCDYKIWQGYGASPALYRGLVIAAADNHLGGVVAGLDRATGKLEWEHQRPEQPNYTSPIIMHVDGRDQLIMTGCDTFTSLDPATGKLLWEVAGSTTECVTSTVTDGKLVYSSGGYPKNHIAAMAADGSGKLAWETNDRAYVPSLLVKEGHLYGVLDAGVAACWHCETGRSMWKKRLGGQFSSSPVLVGDVIYATSESGVTYVYRATPDRFELLGENKLGDHTLATPTICGGKIYMRVESRTDNDGRQEWLYCIE
jgi:outer membrane protein assembly factor BamB